jgi:hypothetical protein
VETECVKGGKVQFRLVEIVEISVPFCNQLCVVERRVAEVKKDRPHGSQALCIPDNHPGPIEIAYPQWAQYDREHEEADDRGASPMATTASDLISVLRHRTEL